MRTQLYVEQRSTWPGKGRHILAQFDAESVNVYQAYRPAIAHYAVAHQRFGGEFSYTRMSWIKPNFLWMMYRSGWALKEGQECILCISLKRAFFDELLRSAVASTFDASRFVSHEQWQTAVAKSDVRLQWDPDHDPVGRAVERRAVQLGLRGKALQRYGHGEVLAIEDITGFVEEQRVNLKGGLEQLVMPEESVYEPEAEAARVVGVDAW